MSSHPTPLQTILAIAASAATAAILYSEWFHQCCMGYTRGVLTILTLPAEVIALLLAGGNVHGTQEWPSYVGLAVQFYILLWLIR